MHFPTSNVVEPELDELSLTDVKACCTDASISNLRSFTSFSAWISSLLTLRLGGLVLVLLSPYGAVQFHTFICTSLFELGVPGEKGSKGGKTTPTSASAMAVSTSCFSNILHLAQNLEFKQSIYNFSFNLFFSDCFGMGIWKWVAIVNNLSFLHFSITFNEGLSRKLRN